MMPKDVSMSLAYLSPFADQATDIANAINSEQQLRFEAKAPAAKLKTLSAIVRAELEMATWGLTVIQCAMNRLRTGLHAVLETDEEPTEHERQLHLATWPTPERVKRCQHVHPATHADHGERPRKPSDASHGACPR